jgi:hypothetical protein
MKIEKFNAKRWAKAIYADEGTIIQKMSYIQLERYVFERCAGLTRNERYDALARLEDIVHDNAAMMPRGERIKQWTHEEEKIG